MAEMQDLEPVGELEAVEQEIAKQEPAKDVLPEKYRGKAIEDVIKMHQAAEGLIDRQSREVGEVRRLADELIRSQLHKPKEEEKPPEVDFFENPQEAINQAIRTNPEVQAAKQYAVQAQQGQAKARLMQAHPDFTNVVQDNEFAAWVKASKIRTQLYNQAEAYDFESADELLSTFKSLKAVKQQQVTQVDKTARNQAITAASVDTGGSGEGSRKVYRRADLIQLKLRDPQAFAARQDEIDRAYQEGRVK